MVYTIRPKYYCVICETWKTNSKKEKYMMKLNKTSRPIRICRKCHKQLKKERNK